MTEATERVVPGAERDASSGAPSERGQGAGDPAISTGSTATPVAQGLVRGVGQGSPVRRRIEWAAAVALKLLLAGVFLVAGVEKASDSRTFAEQIANYQLFSEWSAWGAALLPAIEITSAVVLLIGPRRWSRSATAVLIGMLIMFTLAIIQAWSRGINTDCGCFGQGSSPVGVWSVLRNSGLLLASAALMWLTAEARSVDRGWRLFPPASRREASH